MMNPNQAQFGGSFQQPPAQQQKGCLGRNWKWMLPVGCLGLILGLVALVGGIFFIAMSAMKSSDVYQGALGIAQTHPAATERLGEPIKDGWFVKGNVKLEGGGGSADLEIPVSGPKNSGTLHVTATNAGGTWMYERLDLAVGGQTVSLLDRNPLRRQSGTAASAGDDAADAAGDAGGETPGGGGGGAATPADGRTVSGGVLNGKALSKPEPAYPALAKSARASGTVTVQVTVGVDGRVVSAEAVAGHPLLRPAAAAAARQARFSPTLQGREPVKVSGVLTYNFVLEQ